MLAWKKCSLLIILLLFSQNLSAASQGFIVASVSLSNILHPGESATNVQWLVQISLNGGGQSLVGTLDKSEINYQGLTSVYPLQISGSTDPEQAFYVINNNQPQPVTAYTTSIQKGTLTASCILTVCHYTATAASSCPSNSIGEWKMVVPANGYFGGISSDTVVGRLCFVSQQIGVKAAIPSTPNIQFSSHLNLLANGKQEKLDLSYNQQSATSSGGLVQANWVGSLVTGNAPPNGGDYVAIGSPQGSNWIVKSAVDFDSYKTASNNFVLTQQYSADSVPAQCGSSVTFPSGAILGDQNLQPYIDSYMTCLQTLAQNQYSMANQLANNLVINGVGIGSRPAQLSSQNGQPAFVVDIKDYFVTNPVLILRFRGDFLGVVIPLGKPKILSVTSDCFNSGDQGTIKLTVQNIGNAEGSFYPDLSDCKMISSQSPPKYSVGAGQTQNIDIPIFTTGANSNIKQSCNVKVTDYNGGGSDTAQVSVCIKEANQCDPNKPVLQGKSICPCKNVDGTYKPATGSECTYCENGIVADESGTYVCGVATSAVSGGAIEQNSALGEALTYGTDQLGNAHIPISIGPLNMELTLGTHAAEVAKSSSIAFPNVGAGIAKGLLSTFGKSGCKLAVVKASSIAGEVVGDLFGAPGVGTMVGGAVGGMVGTKCDEYVDEMTGG